MEPLLQYVLLALGLIASLCLFLSLKRELYAQGRKHRQEIEALGVTSQPATRSGFNLNQEFNLNRGFNLNLRMQAMRLLRHGEDVAHVAAALGVPYREVELLIRVQRMAAEQSFPVSRVTPIVTPPAAIQR